MSDTIDKRVVEMRFDNQQFESRVSTTMGTLEKLKNALKFKDAGDGLDELDKKVKNTNFNPLAAGVEAVQVKFSALQVAAMTALQNIVNRAVDAGIELAKSLSVDQISAGFNEYELKMGSIQTIMAGTGESLETVNMYLDELNHYADKTIYSFSDMTSNIGKFTNAGVALEDAVSAIQGVSNVAAVSGANANEASRAMYNFAQALSAGYVKLIDWKSIENANMATVEFKQTLLDTALAMGTVVEEEGMYVTTTTDANGKVSDLFDATSMFNDSLSHQWMTTDVLVQALSAYSTDIREMSEAEVAAYEEKLRAIGYTEEQIKKLEELGQKAFDSAQDVKTFTQLLDTLRESVGSGWAQTFEIIFGDFEEAKAMWSTINDVVGAILQKQADARNDLLKKWAESGGRDMLMSSFAAVWREVLTVTTALKRAWQSVFPPMTAQRLVDMTAKLRKFIGSMHIGPAAADNLRKSFQGLFSILGIGVDIVKEVANFLKDLLLPGLKEGGSSVLEFTANLGENVKAFRDWIKENGYIRKGLEAIQGLLTSARDKVKGWIASFKELPEVQDLVAKVEGKLSEFATMIREKFPNAAEKFDEFKASFSELWKKKDFSKITEMLKSFGSTFKTDFLAAWEKFKVSETFKPFIDGIQNLWTKVKTIFSSLGGAFTSFKTTLQETRAKLDDTASKLGQSFSKIEGVFAPVAGFLSKHIGDIIAALMVLFVANTLKKFIVGASKLADTCSNAIKLITSPFKAIGELMTEMKAALRSFSGAANAARNALNAFALLEVVAAIGGLAYIMVKLKDYKLSDFKTGAAVVGGIAVVVMAILALIAKINANKAKIDPAVIKKQTDGMLKVLELAAALYLVVKSFREIYDVIKDGNSKAAIYAAVGVVVGLGVLVAAMKILDKGHGIKNVTSLRSLVGVGIALKLLVSSFADLYDVLSEANWEQLKEPLIAFGAAVVALLGILGILSRSKSVKGVGTNLILSVLSLKLLISVLKDLADPEFNLSGLQDNWKSIAAIVVAFGALMVALNKFPGSAGTGIGLLAAAAAVRVLVSAVVVLGGMDIATIQRGAGAVAELLLFLGIFSLLSNALGKSASLKTAVNLLAVSVAVGILAGIIVVLSLLNPEDVVIGTAAISAMLLSVGVMMALSSLASKLTMKSFVGMVMVIGVLAGAVVALSFIDPADVVTGTAAMSALMVCAGIMVALMAIAKNLKFGAFAGLSLVIASLAGSIWLIASVDSGVGKATAALSALMVLFGLMSKMLSTASTEFSTAGPMGLAGIAICVAVVGACAGLIAALSQLPNIDAAVQIALAMGVLMAAVGIAMQGVAAVGELGDWKALGIGLTGMVAVIGIVALVIAGIVALNELVPGAQDALDRAMPLFRSLGKAIGEVVGGFIDGLFNLGPDSTLGSQLEDFGTSMGSFAESMSGITDEAANGVKAIATMIAALAAKDLMDAITNLLGGKVTTLTQFSAQLPQFGEDMAAFSDALGTDFNPDNVAKAATAGESLTDMVGNLPTSGGWKEKILGSPMSMTQFATNMNTFVAMIKNMANEQTGLGSLTDTQLGSIDAAATAGQKLIDLQGKLPSTGGFAQTILGTQQDLGVFSTNVESYCKAIRLFCLDETNGLKGLTENDVAPIGVAATAGGYLVDLEKALPDEEGWFSKIFGGGKQDLGDFGDDAVDFAGSMKKALSAEDGLGALSLGSLFSIGVATAIVNAFKGFLSSTGGAELNTTGLVDLGTAISTFGYNFSTFYGYIEDTDTALLSSVVSQIKDLAGTLSDSDSITSFGSSLETLASTGITNFALAFTDAIPGLTANVGAFVDAAIQEIADSESNFDTHGGHSAVKYITAIKDETGTAKTIADGLVSAILGRLEAAVTTFGDRGRDSVSAYLTKFQNAAKNQNTKKAGSDLSKAILDGLGTDDKAFSTKGDSFAEAFVGAITAYKQSAMQAAGGLKTGALNGLANIYNDALTKGYNFGDGFIEGIYGKGKSQASSDRAYAAGGYLGSRALEGLRNAIDAHSPSRKAGEAADDFGVGFVSNLLLWITQAGEAAYSLGDITVDSLNQAIANIPYRLSGELNFDPVIRPVVDLSSAQQSVSTLNDMFNKSIGVVADTASITGVSVAAAKVKTLASSETTETTAGAPQEPTTFQNTFYITSNNPEEVANAVSRKLQRQIERKESTWARSSGMGSPRLQSGS